VTAVTYLFIVKRKEKKNQKKRNIKSRKIDKRKKMLVSECTMTGSRDNDTNVLP